ncbi:hypothetical protein [Erwinia sp. JH02]|uniref:hypothetical protein n=1 Tax=Erwinia sp. JH02 TaxID=2733394 RepID=UPI0014878571|nr:hypothetical protein [Erwinia sp. JH02]NNS07344.1 hypothetical protein [Erwinia sp. JH02]
MRINKLAIASVFIILTSGCASLPTPQQQQRAFDNEEHKTRYGEKWTVKKLKEHYKEETGEILVVPDAIACGWDGSCYYNAWAHKHDQGIDYFESKKREQEKAAEEKCLTEPDCKRNLEVSNYNYSLKNSYIVTVGSHPYQQAEYDMVVRDMCEKSALSQKKGVGLESLINNIQDLPGISPQDRSLIASVAESCWNLSRLGSDWKEPLRKIY